MSTSFRHSSRIERSGSKPDKRKAPSRPGRPPPACGWLGVGAAKPVMLRVPASSRYDCRRPRGRGSSVPAVPHRAVRKRRCACRLPAVKRRVPLRSCVGTIIQTASCLTHHTQFSAVLNFSSADNAGVHFQLCFHAGFFTAKALLLRNAGMNRTSGLCPS